MSAQTQPMALKTGYLSREAKQKLIHRLNRINGHITGITRMIEGDACCDDLLIQVAATRAAMTQVAVKLLEDHLATCVKTCMDGSEEEMLARVTRAMSLVLRQS